MTTDLSIHNADLTDAESHALQTTILALFTAQAERYTQGLSGSLPKETADELMTSIFYTLDIQPTEPASYRPLVGQDIFAVFSRAQAQLEQKKRRALSLIQFLCLHTDDLGCLALRSTLSSLLTGIQQYDSRFFAHHIPGSIDYQLCILISESLMGIDYALAYLQRLSLEMQLLARFPVHRVLALLDGMSSRWRELVCNLLTPVLENAMALALLDIPTYRLHVSSEQRSLLLKHFHAMTVGQIHHDLNSAAHILAGELGTPDALPLLTRLAQELAPRVFEAIQREDRSHVFFSFGFPTSCSKG